MPLDRRCICRSSHVTSCFASVASTKNSRHLEYILLVRIPCLNASQAIVRQIGTFVISSEIRSLIYTL